jgi:hypothetical protein
VPEVGIRNINSKQESPPVDNESLHVFSNVRADFITARSRPDINKPLYINEVDRAIKLINEGKVQDAVAQLLDVNRRAYFGNEPDNNNLVRSVGDLKSRLSREPERTSVVTIGLTPNKLVVAGIDPSGNSFAKVYDEKEVRQKLVEVMDPEILQIVSGGKGIPTLAQMLGEPLVLSMTIPYTSIVTVTDMVDVLSSIFCEPLTNASASGEVKKVLLVPPPTMAGLPYMPIVYNSKCGFGADARVVLAPGLTKNPPSDLISPQSAAASIIINDPDANVPLDTQQEVSVLQKARPDRYFKFAEIPLQSAIGEVAKFSRQNNLGVLHLVIHGFGENGSEPTSLLDANGQKIPITDLQRYVKDNNLKAPLIMLSFCRSGLSDDMVSQFVNIAPNGVELLRNQAGYVGVTTWDVQDSAIGLLTAKVLQRVLSNNQKIPDAFRSAWIEAYADNLKNPKDYQRSLMFISLWGH